jgi:hypothetical protein
MNVIKKMMTNKQKTTIGDYLKTAAGRAALAASMTSGGPKIFHSLSGGEYLKVGDDFYFYNRPTLHVTHLKNSQEI